MSSSLPTCIVVTGHSEVVREGGGEGVSGFSGLFHKLRERFHVEEESGGLERSRLAGANAVVVGCPQEKLTKKELDALGSAAASGSAVLVVLGGGGERGGAESGGLRSVTNVNYLLEEHGMRVNSDTMVASSLVTGSGGPGGILHPKDVYVADGTINRELPAVPFVYAHGASLRVAKPAAPLLASGDNSYPVNQPVLARARVGGSGGQILALGSTAMLSDRWLSAEGNGAVVDALLDVLAGTIVPNPVDEENPDVPAYTQVPDTEALAVRLRSCLEDSDPLPAEFTDMFDLGLAGLDLDVVADVADAFEAMGVKHEPLSLIPPELEVPLPPQAPALFPPELIGPAPPALELFDLDGAFASDKVRLAQLTNNCIAPPGTGPEPPEELEFFIRSAAAIVGISVDDGGGKGVLATVLQRLVKFKKR